MLLSVEALLGSTVSVEVTASEDGPFVGVEEGSWTCVEGAEVVKRADPAPPLDPGEAF